VALVELSVPLLAALVCIMGVLTGGLTSPSDRRSDRARSTTYKFGVVYYLCSYMGSIWAVYGLVALSAANVHDWGLQLLAAMCVWLLFSACYEAWWLPEPKGIVAQDEEREVSQSDADIA
jgi:hypothetical protein